ncbi:MAG: MBL fold metallo-hydrolase [Lachnospiraceae bacterium]
MQQIIRLGLDGVNAYLIQSSGGFVLVDTGGHIVTDKVPNNRGDMLLAKLDSAGCSRDNLNLIILTHGDNDHAANAQLIRQNYQASIAMHPDDLALVSNPTLDIYMQSYSYRPLIYKMMFCCLRGAIKKVTKKMVDDFTSFDPDYLLSDEERLDNYGVKGKVVHLPGHTMGSIGVLLDDGELIAGMLKSIQRRMHWIFHC